MSAPFGPGYVATSDGGWRWTGTPGDGAGAPSPVALTSTEDTDDDLTDAEREALAESDDWRDFVAGEVADIAARHGLT